MQLPESPENGNSPQGEGLTRYILHTNTPNETFCPLPLDVVLKRLNKRTVIDMGDADIIIRDIPSCNLYVPKVILPKRRLPLYRAMTHCIVYNNPGVELIYVLSYLYYVNERFTMGKPMALDVMIKTITAEYDHILETGHIKVFKTKRYWTHPKYPTRKRISLAAQARGKEQVERSVQLIQEAVTQLERQGKKPTQEKANAVLNGKPSLSTIKRHWDKIVLKRIID